MVMSLRRLTTFAGDVGRCTRWALLPRLSPIKPSLEMEVQLPESPDVNAKSLKLAQ